MCMTFTSCEDDAEIPDHGPAMNPEIETAGVYSGTWTRIDMTTNEESTADGTLTFVAGQEAYTTTVTATCPTFSLNLTSAANIAPGGQGFIYYNVIKETNGFGVIFSGNITTAKVADIYFQITQRDGRKTKTFKYSFSGVKNN